MTNQPLTAFALTGIASLLAMHSRPTAMKFLKCIAKQRCHILIIKSWHTVYLPPNFGPLMNSTTIGHRKNPTFYDLFKLNLKRTAISRGLFRSPPLFWSCLHRGGWTAHMHCICTAQEWQHHMYVHGLYCTCTLFKGHGISQWNHS